MQPKALIFLAVSVILFGIASWFGADWAVRALEEDTKSRVNASLTAAGETWASIETDGLIVGLKGEAPSETSRFRALEVAARIVDTNRIDDKTTIKANTNAQMPDFSVEILRNDADLSVIGLVPGKAARIDLLQQIEPLRQEGQFTDLMESLEFDPPEGWTEAVAFAVAQTQNLPKSRVVVRPGGVSIEAFFDDGRAEKQAREDIEAAKPDDLQLSLEFSSPKIVVAPFRFVAAKRDGAFEIAECWADTELAKGQIYTTLSDLNAPTSAECPVALGAPSPDWAGAVSASATALNTLENGQITITDADVTFAASDPSEREAFEAASASLRDTLPGFFSLRLEAPAPSETTAPNLPQVALFQARLTEDRTLTMTGPVRDTMAKEATLGFASAQFADTAISAELPVAGNIPPGWLPQVLAALDALSLLYDGSVELTLDGLSVAGRSGQEDTAKFISDALKDQIDANALSLEIAYDPELANIVTQEDLDARECERQLAGMLRQAQIIFDPNSSTISAESELLVDEIAFIITSCPDATFEIGGHTDSQGREEMNLALSQSRADAVMDALLSRDVLLDQLASRGYGETEPIADNETEDGRTRNRRIAFKLIQIDEDKDEQN